MNNRAKRPRFHRALRPCLALRRAPSLRGLGTVPTVIARYPGKRLGDKIGPLGAVLGSAFSGPRPSPSIPYW
jgi:hypothetical protein